MTKSIIGKILFVHDISEHPDRYESLLPYFKEQEWKLHFHPLRGHGVQMAQRNSNAPKYCHWDSDGWDGNLKDLQVTITTLATQNPIEPFAIMGQGIGATLILALLCQDGFNLPPNLISVILLNSTAISNQQNKRLLSITKFLSCFQYKSSPSKLLDKLLINTWNKGIKEGTWRSQDPKAIKEYEEDPFCGSPCSLQIWLDIANAHKNLATQWDNTPKNTNYLLLGGSDNPILEGGQVIFDLSTELSKRANTFHKVYPELRHDIIFDSTVKQDIIDWLKTSYQGSE